jgi:pimeloyl-ACP methyl ester carboxylesterase
MSVVSVLRKILPVHRIRERTDYDTACRQAPGHFIDLPLGRCHYRAAGEGAPVVLIHGFFYHSIMWAPVTGGLSKAFRTLAIDLLGWGYSSRDETRDYNYPLYSEQLQQFLDAMGIEKVHLIGQSMGGGTAIRFACEHPDRVEKLVLVDAASLPNPMPLTAKIFALPLVGEILSGLGGNRLSGRNLKNFWFHRGDLVTPEYVEGVVGPLHIRGSSWTVLNILRTLDFGSQEEQVAALGDLDIPTLIVWGREDKAVPLALGEQMHAMMQGSELWVMEECGHTPHEEEPDLFVERVTRFLRGTE